MELLLSFLAHLPHAVHQSHYLCHQLLPRILCQISRILLSLQILETIPPLQLSTLTCSQLLLKLNQPAPFYFEFVFTLLKLSQYWSPVHFDHSMHVVVLQQVPVIFGHQNLNNSSENINLGLKLCQSRICLDLSDIPEIQSGVGLPF